MPSLLDITSAPDKILGALRLSGRFGNNEERLNFAREDWSQESFGKNVGSNGHGCGNGENLGATNNGSNANIDMIPADISDHERYLRARTSVINKPEQPRISSWDAGWNVANAIQGMFVLGLPYAVLHGGYLSLLLIILTAIVCCYTGKILIECLYETNEYGVKERVRETYVEIAQHCWGNRVGLWVVNINQLIELLMTCVLYIVISGNLMASSFPHAMINERGWSVIAAVILTPCIFLRNLRTVSKLSLGCSIAQVVVMAVTLLYCLAQITHWKWSAISFGVDAQRFPVSIGVIVFSYTSQIFLPSLEGNMEHRNSFKPMLYWSYAAACASKAVFALICYLTWAHETKEVITDNLPSGFRGAINVMLVVKALLSYPLPYYASVEVLEQTVFTGPIGGLGSLLHTKTNTYGNLSESSEVSSSYEDHNSNRTEETSITEPIKRIQGNQNNKIGETISESRFTFPTCYKPDGNVQLWAYALRGGLVLGTLIMAVCIPHFALLMGLTGSLTGASLAFLLPTMFYLQMRWRHLQQHEIAINALIAILGIVVSISGIYHSIQGLYYAYNPNHELYDVTNTSLSSGASFNSTIVDEMLLFNEVPDLK